MQGKERRIGLARIWVLEMVFRSHHELSERLAKISMMIRQLIIEWCIAVFTCEDAEHLCRHIRAYDILITAEASCGKYRTCTVNARRLLSPKYA